MKNYTLFYIWIILYIGYPEDRIRKVYKFAIVLTEYKMGEIVNTKTSSDKIIYKIELNQEEALQLKNHMKGVHMFSEELCNNETRIIERGNKGGAKYFVIPLSLKSRKKKKYNKISYQKLEIDKKVFYICVVNKDLLF